MEPDRAYPSCDFSHGMDRLNIIKFSFKTLLKKAIIYFTNLV